MNKETAQLTHDGMTITYAVPTVGEAMAGQQGTIMHFVTTYSAFVVSVVDEQGSDVDIMSLAPSASLDILRAMDAHMWGIERPLASD